MKITRKRSEAGLAVWLVFSEAEQRTLQRAAELAGRANGMCSAEDPQFANTDESMFLADIEQNCREYANGIAIIDPVAEEAERAAEARNPWPPREDL